MFDNLKKDLRLTKVRSSEEVLKETVDQQMAERRAKRWDKKHTTKDGKPFITVTTPKYRESELTK